MNANELADYLDNNVEAMIMSEQQHIDKASTMLRQQQAEIDRLKSLCISYIDEEWSGTSSYQNKIDEVNLGHFKESE